MAKLHKAKSFALGPWWGKGELKKMRVRTKAEYYELSVFSSFPDGKVIRYCSFKLQLTFGLEIRPLYTIVVHGFSLIYLFVHFRH